jgi:hypothetical protein
VLKGHCGRQSSGERGGEGGDLGVRMCRVLAVGFVVGCSSWYVRLSTLYYTELDWTQLSISVIGVAWLVSFRYQHPKRVVHVATCVWSEVCDKQKFCMV